LFKTKATNNREKFPQLSHLMVAQSAMPISALSPDAILKIKKDFFTLASPDRPVCYIY